MGSVMSNIDCPNCNSPECTEDFYYKTGEGYTFCPDCGYSHSATIINRSKRIMDLKDEDWEIKLIEKPYGSFYIKYQNHSGGHMGTLLTEESFLELKEKINNSDIENIQSVLISRFVDGKIKKELIFERKGLINEIKNEE